MVFPPSEKRLAVPLLIKNKLLLSVTGVLEASVTVPVVLSVSLKLFTDKVFPFPLIV